jgi:hypothetical protein
VAQINPSRGSEFDASGEFSQRVTRFAAPAAGIVAFGIGLVSSRRRRLEYASALESGQEKVAQMAVVSLEAWVWTLAAAGVSLGTFAVAIRYSTGDLPSALLLIGLEIVGAGAAGSMIGAVAGAVPVRQEHMFRYFKSR